MARYADAVEWIVDNDDTSEIDNTCDRPEDVAGIAPVTVVMVAETPRLTSKRYILGMLSVLDSQSGSTLRHQPGGLLRGPGAKSIVSALC